ncbi:MAG: beta-ketoacyl-ACP synthase III [Syntrophomonadaceae bacterium]
MLKIQVLGTGHALPAQKLTNQQLEKIVATSHDWIVERTGIYERRIGDSKTKTSDMCWQAAGMALENAGVAPEQLDLIIVASVTPDMLFPSTACIVQEHLGAWNAAAFDLEAGCTGFIYALTVAEKFLASGSSNYALIIGGEMLSRITDYEDRNTCILFGDGAGAAVLGKGPGPSGILNTIIGADGRGSNLLYMPAGGANLPSSRETVENRLHYIKMNGNEVFRFATRIIADTSDKILTGAGLTYQDIDLFIPHQANLRIIKTAMKRMRIPAEKTMINIDHFGNMSAASIPVALSLAVEEGRLKPGDIVLMVGFGAGLTYGGALIRWGKD